MSSKSSMTTGLLSLFLLDAVQGHVPSVFNKTETITGFEPCDALIAANLSHAVYLPSSPLYPTLVKGSWTEDIQRSPYCFVVPSTSIEVSQTLVALNKLNGAGDWHIAVRSGGHGGDNQNSITNGVIIDLSHLNATTYDAATKLASVGTGARWGDVYTELQEHNVSVTGGRQSVVGVGGLTLGGGVGWTTPRTGFACDNVISYEVVLASGEIVNANASCHPDLWRALKGGSGNFGIVTRFDIDTFPAQNITIERRSIGMEHTDDYINAVVDFTDLDQSFDENAMVSVLSYLPGSGTSMTVTEVNTVGDTNTTAFNAFNRMPLLTPSHKHSLSLPDVAAIEAPELPKGAQTVGTGPVTIANDRRVIRQWFDQHNDLVAELNATLGQDNFTTILEFQPLNSYFADISAQKGGNMLGLERDARNKLYFSLGVTLVTPESAKQLPQVYQKVAAAVQRVKKYAESVGASEDFIYLPYADAAQNPLASYGADNVRYMKEVSRRYDPTRFFQRMVPGGFKIDRVD